MTTVQNTTPPSGLSEFWFYFSRNKGAVIGLVVFLIILFLAVFAAFIAPHDPAVQDALVASRERAIQPGQLLQLQPAQPVEIAVGVMAGQDNGPTQQGDRLRRESRCRQQQFGCLAIDAALAPA